MDPHSPPAGLPPAAGLGAPPTACCPLVDWVLPNPDVCGVVLKHLAPADVLGLRAACKAARAAAADHPWDEPPPRPSADATSWWKRPARYTVAGRAALSRWRACFPAARRVVVRGGRVGLDDVTDADVAALTGVRTLVLVDCNAITDAALAGLTRVTALSVDNCPHLGGAAWAHLPRLAYLSHVCSGPVSDAHLAALAGARSMRLRGTGVRVTDAGLAEHLGARGALTHLDLTLFNHGRAAASLTGAGLAGCAHLEVLILRTAGSSRWRLAAGACLAASAGSLRQLRLEGCTGLSDAVLAALPRLTRLRMRDCAGFSGSGLATAAAAAAPSLRSLNVGGAPDFVGAGLGGLAALLSLAVNDCGAFTEGALGAAGASCPSLAAVRYAPPATLLDPLIMAERAAAVLGPGWSVTVPGGVCPWYWTARRTPPPRTKGAAGAGAGGVGGARKRRREEMEGGDHDAGTGGGGGGGDRGLGRVVVSAAVSLWSPPTQL